jgi:hypothetical protein
VTDEEFVHAWFRRKTGLEFAIKYSDWTAKVLAMLKSGLLNTADPGEGLMNCTCGVKPGTDIRYYLTADDLMSICPRCDSWTVVRRTHPFRG